MSRGGRARYARQLVIKRSENTPHWVANLMQVQCGVIKHRRWFQKYTWIIDGFFHSDSGRQCKVIEKGKTWRMKEAWREIESLLTTSNCSPLR